MIPPAKKGCDSMDNKIGLYLHIPFCMSKCAYCDFYSNAGESDYERFVNAMALHMEDYAPSLRGREIDSVYIGGGTPTVLPTEQLTTLLDCVYENFSVSRSAEVSMECNPATADTSKLKKCRKAGVNRLSIGIQSASDAELHELSRIHTWNDAVACYNDARRAGFDNINLDIMYGIPLQTPDSLRDTLDAVTDLDPEHISLYCLKLEDGTPMARNRHRLALPDDDTVADMYFDSIDLLASRGYDQYEISNFAREGYACRHNIRYWQPGEYLGLGPGAHSYLGSCRFSFRRDTEQYISAMEHPERSYNIIDERYTIGQNDRIGEYVMLRLRTSYGIDLGEFRELFGRDFDALYGSRLPQYENGGYMKREDGRVFLTPEGMFVSSYILSDLLDFDGDIAEGEASGKRA